MPLISSYLKVGISPTLLFPESFTDDLVHFHAVNTACSMPQFEVLETFLSEDAELRKRELRVIRESGVTVNYNYPLILSQDGPKNPCSDQPEIRKAGLAFAKLNIDFAGEAQAPLFVMASPPDKGADKREELKKRFAQYYLEVAEHARQYKMDVCLEPIERHRFKQLLFGPTDESAAFILDLKKQGADNVSIMCDFGHLPLMEEDVKTAVALSMQAGLALVQFGNAVLDPSSKFYGHTHPPIGVQGGMFDLEDLIDQFSILFDCGYIPKVAGGQRPCISLEAQPYPGVSPALSAQVMYEKLNSAFNAALAKTQ